jgi:hypothetical protein
MADSMNAYGMCFCCFLMECTNSKAFGQKHHHSLIELVVIQIAALYMGLPPAAGVASVTVHWTQVGRPCASE